MTPPTFDLQAHSLHSDGALRAREVVAAAAAAGVELLALTDHDTVAGVDEAIEAGRELGIGIVPAVELSAVDPAAADIHVLGYGIDHRALSLLTELERYRQDRLARTDRMVANLRAAGLDVDDALLDARRADGVPIGRPHIAQAVLAAPANAARLETEGLRGPGDVIEAYLVDGAPGFSGRTIPSVPEAIDLIHAHGGVAVWAHPFWDVEDPDEVAATLARYVDAGLDGVEAFYVTHDEAQTRMLAAEADRLGLLTTGSADFHGPAHREFSGFRAFALYGLTPRLGPIQPAPGTAKPPI